MRPTTIQLSALCLLLLVASSSASLQAFETMHKALNAEISSNTTAQDLALKQLGQVLNPKYLLGPEFDFGARSKLCQLAMAQYLGGLVSLKKWALQMADATAKGVEGIMYLNHEFLGQYDECIAVVNPNGTFKGQHCVLEGNLALHIPGLPSKQKSVFWYAVCVPSLCSAADLNNAWLKVGNLTKGLVTITASEDNCYTDTTREVSDGDWVVVGFLGLLGLLAVLSTIYEVYRPKGNPVLTSFSVRKNGSGLFKITNQRDQMTCLNGLRVLSMAWIVFFHTFTTMLVGPVNNISDHYAAKKAPLYAVLVSAYLAVDTFLLISGLLLAASFFRVMAKSGTYDVPLNYIHRYFRLTPSYAMVILFQVTIFQYIGDGPMWNFLENSQTSVCHDYWWSGLLYVQNYVNPDKLCLEQTWYLSADMQLYWISPLILYPMWKWRKFAPAYITLLIAIFTCLPFAIAYTNNLSPIPLWDNTGKQNSMDNYPTYSRATPWLVGVFLAYFIFDTKERNSELRTFKFTSWTIAGWTLAAALGGLSLFGLLSLEYNGYDIFGGSFYLAFHRLGWSLFVAFLILACINGKGGFVNDLLSWDVFQPMAKLSYGVYLTHITVILYRVAILRTNVHFSLSELFFMFLGVYVVAHFTSSVLYLLIEAPFFIIDRYLLRNAKIFPWPTPKLKPEVKVASPTPVA